MEDDGRGGRAVIRMSEGLPESPIDSFASVLKLDRETLVSNEVVILGNSDVVLTSAEGMISVSGFVLVDMTAGGKGHQ